nr:response regulator [Ideonella sp.]
MTTPPPTFPAGWPAARAVLADDERLMREQLRQRLAEAWPSLQVVAEAPHGEAAVAEVERHHPDLVFLDIRMPGMGGLDAAQRILHLPTHDETPDGWPGCEVVFVTAYDEYAVQAFEQGALDYVLKPA